MLTLRWLLRGRCRHAVLVLVDAERPTHANLRGHCRRLRWHRGECRP